MELGVPRALDPRLRGLGQSPTVAINERSDALRAAGREIIKLGLGQSPFPVPDLVVAALSDHAAEKDYLPTQGLPRLRDAVARYTNRLEGTTFDAADVVVGPGSKELMFLLQLCFDGDLLLPSPSWVSYAPQARLAGRAVHWLSTGADHLVDPDALDRWCRGARRRPRLLILNYPSNPTGATYDAAALAALAAVCRRHGVLLLSDEIYGALDHDGAHVSAARFYPEGTIVSGGLSKWCGAGGWRLGTFVMPPALRWLRDAIVAAASETFTSVSAPIQHASVVAFEPHDAIDEYLTRSRRILKSLGALAHRTLVDAGVECVPPRGGFYLFPRFATDDADSTTFCERALDATGVAFLPGSAFGRPGHELSARLAYVDFDGAAALQAATGDLDEAWLDRHCTNVIRGIRRLADFVTGCGGPPVRRSGS